MEVVRSSHLAAPAERVWAHATSMAGVNREMTPLLRMTYPEEATSLDAVASTVPLGETLFVSWILGLGFLPVERWQLALRELGPGMRFVEESRTLSFSSWRHERSVAPHGDGGSTLIDRVTFEPRAASPVVAPAIRALFAHRHRRLVRLFGRAG